MGVRGRNCQLSYFPGLALSWSHAQTVTTDRMKNHACAPPDGTRALSLFRHPLHHLRIRPHMSFAPLHPPPPHGAPRSRRSGDTQLPAAMQLRPSVWGNGRPRRGFSQQPNLDRSATRWPQDIHIRPTIQSPAVATHHPGRPGEQATTAPARGRHYQRHQVTRPRSTT